MRVWSIGERRHYRAHTRVRPDQRLQPTRSSARLKHTLGRPTTIDHESDGSTQAVTATPLANVRAHLDQLLKPGSSSDPEGNGLILGGPVDVRRLGAALNTSFWAIDAAAAAQVDLLLVHHAPWSQIDLHLRERKLARLSERGIALYAAHDSLDRAPELTNLEWSRRAQSSRAIMSPRRAAHWHVRPRMPRSRGSEAK